MLVKMIKHYGLMSKKPLYKGHQYDLDEDLVKLVVAQKAGKKVKKG